MNEDFNLIEGPYIKYDPDYILQQVDVLFDCTPGQLAGDSVWGTDYEYMLYDLKLSAEDIEKAIKEDLGQLDLRGWSYKVSASLYHGTEQDIALVEIELDNGEHIRRKTYKIA